MLETRAEDLAWEKGRWYVKGDPEKGAMIEDIAAYAYSGEAMPEGLEGGLDAQVIYDPPNLTYPCGAYICVVDVDPDTAAVKVRRFIAVDDCGVRINPMIVEGQIHGGLAEGIGIALMEVITFDDEGNCLNGSFMDYLIPTALECPDFELGETITPCPHHPARSQGRRRVAERRLPAGDRQRDHRRPAREPRRRPRRHAVHAGASVGRDAGPPRAAAVMLSGPLTARARELTERGAAFVTATVVRVEHPTSARPGNVALVHEDGSMEGFVGGVCAQNSVRLYSLKAIERGEPLLLRILPEGPGPGPGVATEDEDAADAGQEIAHDEGSITVQNPCLSGGAIEVFLEPFLPAPRMIVAGDTPIAAALLRLAPELGLDAVDSRGADSGPPTPIRRRPRPGRGRPRSRRARDPPRGARGGRPLRRPVASRKRGAAVLDALRATASRRTCSSGSTRRRASTSAPARRPRSRCRSWRRSSRFAAARAPPRARGPPPRQPRSTRSAG